MGIPRSQLVPVYLPVFNLIGLLTNGGVPVAFLREQHISRSENPESDKRFTRSSSRFLSAVLLTDLQPQVNLVSCPDPFRKNREGVWKHGHTVPCPKGIQSVTQPYANLYIRGQN